MSKPPYKEMTQSQKKDILSRYLLYNVPITQLFDEYREELGCSVSWFSRKMSNMIGDSDLIKSIFKSMHRGRYFRLRFDKCMGHKTDPIWGDMTEDELFCGLPTVVYNDLSIDEKLIYYRNGEEV